MYINILFAFFATLITWGITALGSATVILLNIRKNSSIDSILGFSGGVMIAASFWSLLNPAINKMKSKSDILIIALGIITGMIIMIISDYFINRLNKSCYSNKLLMLIISITIHNIPEGLAVGVAFGACNFNGKISSIIPAIIVATGIAIQNFPEGAAISLPLLNCGCSKRKSFFVGQLSAIVEPIFGVIGALLIIFVNKILPFCLSLAAGCMIFVVIDELIPKREDNNHKPSISFIVGFLIMMILDVIL